MEKGPDAFRTISEVAEDLDLPQHVLRFWETRFPQIRPLKRGGGRRYYRPDDVELLRGIRHLLYGEGYTIRGVQRILKDEGPRYVQAIWRDAEAEAEQIAELDAREERAVRAATVDAGHPGRDRAEEPPRAGPLSGILNLLPMRQREPAEEPPARRAKRRPEADPDLLELPLLPDLAPQVRPPRVEPPLGRAEATPRPMAPLPPVAPEGEGGRFAPAPSTPSYPDADEAADFEPRPFDPRPVEPPAAETRAPESRPAFAFRPVAVEPVVDEPRQDIDYVPERHRPAQAMPPLPVAPTPVTQAPAQAPLRAGGVQENEFPARAKLSRDDVQRLQAALYELQDCRRILDAARDRDG